MSQKFVQEVLLNTLGVRAVEWESDKIVRISRKNKSDFVAGVLWEKIVNVEHLEPLLTSGVQLISNVPKIGLWSGEAIRTCEAHEVAWGRFGALRAACGADDPSKHIDGRIKFSKRALSQHSRCIEFEFLYDVLFRISLDNGKCLLIALLESYDVAADDVRTARENLGRFDVALKGNPNGSIFEEAHDAAQSIGAKVMTMRELMGLMAKGG